ncbi:MAG: protein kinase [Planctomycetota bacterium]
MDTTSEKAIFLEAIELTNTFERERFVETACGTDITLRNNIKALLQANDDVDHPLEKLSIARLQAGVTQGQAGKPLLGSQIGAYQLTQQIGEGGFGLVFLARQESPVKRDVALKIMKPGTGSKEVIARFDAERQAVAMMNHPNIARIFDAGVTCDSLPYFVMELVRGVPITRFAEAHSLSIEERLKLFLDVCSAVQHAHQKGIIHRDLKPSNVMVTLIEQRPVVKVIDFGIAKALGTSLTDKTLHTKLFSIIGTPLYMSPEQADMNGMDVDTRSDVFSLGVILYELLTGVTPLDRQRLDSAGIDELRKIIREKQPVLPSKRLASLRGAKKQVIGHRGEVNAYDKTAAIRKAAVTRLEWKDSGNTTTRLDSSSLRGDLDWIIMKALEKERSRRYESATALADDIRRYLSGRTIKARPPSTVYVLSKFARRHRVVLMTAGLLLVSWIAGTAVSLWQWRQASLANDQKEEALERVEQFTGRLIRANSFIASGQIHLAARRWKLAKQDFDAAISRQPYYADPWLRRGQFFLELRLWNDAADDFARALEFSEAVETPQWWGVGGLLEWSNQREAADQFHEKLQQRLIGRGDDLGWDSIRNTLVTNRYYSPETRQRLADIAERKLIALIEANERFSSGEPSKPPKEGTFGRGGPGRVGLGRTGPGPSRPGFERLGPERLGPKGLGPERPGPERRGFERPGPNGLEFERPGYKTGFDGPGPEAAPTKPPSRDQSRKPVSSPLPLGQYLTAVAQLRAGAHDRTLALLRDAPPGKRNPTLPLHFAPLAISNQLLGNEQDARKALAKSDEEVERMITKILFEDDVQMPWFDQIELIRFNEEAHQLINGRLPDRDWFFEDLRFIGQTLLESDSDR